MALGLIRKLLGTVLRMGDQAVAAQADQLHPIAEVVAQPGEFRLNVLHEGAMGADHHQQHRLLRQVFAVEPASRHLGQIK